MARKDYYDDPDAPVPNSIVPAAVGCVTDAEGRLLLEHRVDNDLWTLPGGTHDYGESIGQQDSIRSSWVPSGLALPIFDGLGSLRLTYMRSQGMLRLVAIFAWTSLFGAPSR